MPSILQSETLLYAQAFAAVNHIKFINPNAYKAECYVLKGHAIHKIKEKIDEESDDPEEAASDANISAILCMASAAQIEVRFPVYLLNLKTKRHSLDLVLDLTITNTWSEELRSR